jgi:hypothetical protein
MAPAFSTRSTPPPPQLEFAERFAALCQKALALMKPPSLFEPPGFGASVLKGVAPDRMSPRTRPCRFRRGGATSAEVGKLSFRVSYEYRNTLETRRRQHLCFRQWAAFASLPNKDLARHNHELLALDSSSSAS